MPPPEPVTRNRAPVLLFALAALAALGCLWVSWCEFKVYAWNEVRLAPAFAVANGINPYPPLGGGPLTTWIYGPVAILVNLPATLAPTLPLALNFAWAINAVVGLVPFAIIFFGSRELRARGLADGGLAIALALLLLPRWHFVMQVADRTAIAGGLLSCWCLARSTLPSASRLAAAAVLATLAIWSKQTETFLALAQFLWLWRASSRAVAWRYLGWLALCNAAAIAVFSAAFGFSNLWLNLVLIPMRLPLADFAPRLAMQPWLVAGLVIVPLVGIAWAARRGFVRAPKTESRRFLHLSVFVFFAMLPVGLLGYFKVGGGTNLLHSWDYFLAGALLAWLAQDQVFPRTLTRTQAMVVMIMALRASEFRPFPHHAFSQDFTGAARILAEHHGGAWFPQNPLITFYAQGRLWHNEDGIATRYYARYGIREPDFRRHLPAPLRVVVYPSIVAHPFTLGLLPDFQPTSRNGAWTLYTSTTPAVPPPAPALPP